MLKSKTMKMKAVIYSKPGCKRCTLAKEKIVSMSLKYIEQDIDETLLEEDERAVNLRAALAYYNEAYPIIYYNGEYYNYPAGLKEIKRSLK